MMRKYKGELILTAQLGGSETDRYEITGESKKQVMKELKDLASRVECKYSVYTNHDYVITRIA